MRKHALCIYLIFPTPTKHRVSNSFDQLQVPFDHNISPPKRKQNKQKNSVVYYSGIWTCPEPGSRNKIQILKTHVSMGKKKKTLNFQVIFLWRGGQSIMKSQSPENYSLSILIQSATCSRSWSCKLVPLDCMVLAPCGSCQKCRSVNHGRDKTNPQSHLHLARGCNPSECTPQ